MRHPALGMVALIPISGLAIPASARGSEAPKAAVHGDLKTFLVGTAPYDSARHTERMETVGMIDARAKLDVDAGDRLRFYAHHAVTGGAVGAKMGSPLGASVEVPEVVDLSWSALEANGAAVTGRTDRLYMKSSVGPFALTLGRQSISFGAGQLFTPLDLVNPFHPAAVDTEYKPGVDAFRFDGHPGPASQVTAVAAYGGDWDLSGTVIAGYGQVSVGQADLGVLLGEVYGDEVLGMSGVFAIGGMGLTTEATVTRPESGDDPFVRAVVGMLQRPTSTTTLALEGYYQGAGADDPDDYPALMAGDRFDRGELWAVGQWYAGASVAQEITPIVFCNLGTVLNLADGSALLLPSIVVSADDDVEIVVGGMMGAGDPPAPVDAADVRQGDTGIRSEFGLYPASIYLQTKLYF